MKMENTRGSRGNQIFFSLFSSSASLSFLLSLPSLLPFFFFFFLFFLPLSSIRSLGESCRASQGESCVTQLGGPLLVSLQDLGKAGLGHTRHFLSSRIGAHLHFLTALPKKSPPFLRSQIPTSHLFGNALAWRSSPLPFLSCPPPSLCSQAAVILRVIFKLEDHAAFPREQRHLLFTFRKGHTHLFSWAFWWSPGLQQLRLPQKHSASYSLSRLQDAPLRGQE